MRVILFFTYGISLFDWKTSGLLEREVYFYKYLNDKYKVKFTFITFGKIEDRTILNYPFIDIVPVYEYLKLWILIAKGIFFLFRNLNIPLEPLNQVL